MLDNLAIPAFVKTPTFQIVAWNRAAVAVFGDYGERPERERNLLRWIFLPGSEEKVHDVDSVRRACLATFRIDIARFGQSEEATALIDELTEASLAFRRLWSEADVRMYGGVQKRLVRPGVGEILLEATVLNVDGSDGLSMFVYSPLDEASARAIARLVERRFKRQRVGSRT
jgi:hypothetical protein